MLRKLVAKKIDDGAVSTELLPLTADKDNRASSRKKSSQAPSSAMPSSSNGPPAMGNGGPNLNLADIGILRNIVSKWKSFSTKRKETGDKSSMYRKGPAPLDEPGKKKRRTVNRCTHGTLDSDVESIRGDSEEENNDDLRNSIASSKGLILYFAKLATSRDEDETIDLQFVYSLLQGGADINFTDKHGQTILHEIARAWHSDVAKFLLSHGADINKGDKKGRTPLHLAASVGYVDMIAFLIENGANINSRTYSELQTPIHYAAKNNSVSSLRNLLKYGASINDRDYKSRTPLFVAAESGRTEAARFLLEAGAPAAIYDDMGNSCLSLMVEKMPGIAIEALEQFHSTDRALRKKYYYLNYLEKMSATDDGENSEGSAKTALQVCVQYAELELIMHPAIRRLLDVKWDLFGKWSSIWFVLVNMIYTIIWTVLGLLLPRDGNYYKPLSKYWWRLVLECIGCIMTVYFILTQVLDARNVEKRENVYKEWRAKQVERDLENCHPRWPEERRYLEGELERIRRNTRGTYFRNAWNIFDWVTHVAVLMVVITRVIAVLWNNDASDQFHPKVFAFTLILIWLRLMKACRAFKALGPFITLLGHVVEDTLKFAFLYFEFFIPYCCAFWIIFGGSKNAAIMEADGKSADGWENFNDLVYSVFEITLVGNYPWESLMAVDRLMAQFLVGTYLAMSAVVCLNLYIALMSDTFARVYENARANAVMQQAMQILNIERTLSKKKRQSFKKFIATECAPQEVYCANEEKEQGPSNKNAQLMHHMDTTIEVVKDMIKELRIEVNDVSKQVGKGTGVKKPTNATSEIMAQREAREWREKQDQQMKEVMNAIADLRKAQEMMNRALKRRQSSYSSQGEPELLTIDSATSSLRRGRKKKKRTDASLERSTSEPAAEGTLKKKTRSKKSRE
eukprot:gene14412-15918_t